MHMLSSKFDNLCFWLFIIINFSTKQIKADTQKHLANQFCSLGLIGSSKNNALPNGSALKKKAIYLKKNQRKPPVFNQLTADNDTALPTGKPLISVSISSASWQCIRSRCSFSSSISCCVAGACLQDSSIQWDSWSIWTYGYSLWVWMMKKMEMDSG